MSDTGSGAGAAFFFQPESDSSECDEREDLLAQLRQQDDVHRTLRQQILEEGERLDEFRELLAHMQKNGRFMRPAAAAAMHIAKGSEEMDMANKLAYENRWEN